jgi:hypothetical protein
MGVGADDDLIRTGQSLQSSGHVRRLADRELRFAMIIGTCVSDDYGAGVDANAHGKRLRCGQAFDRSYDFERRAQGTLRVVLVRSGPSEVDQQTISEILGNVTLVASEDLAADALIGLHELAQFLWIQPVRQCRGAHQIAEQDGELAPFGFAVRRWFDRRVFRAERTTWHWRLLARQLGDRVQQLFAWAEGQSQALEVDVSEKAQGVEVDFVLRQHRSVSLEAESFEPIRERLHVSPFTPCPAGMNGKIDGDV